MSSVPPLSRRPSAPCLGLGRAAGPPPRPLPAAAAADAQPREGRRAGHSLLARRRHPRPRGVLGHRRRRLPRPGPQVAAPRVPHARGRRRAARVRGRGLAARARRRRRRPAVCVGLGRLARRRRAAVVVAGPRGGAARPGRRPRPLRARPGARGARGRRRRRCRARRGAAAAAAAAQVCARPPAARRAPPNARRRPCACASAPGAASGTCGRRPGPAAGCGARSRSRAAATTRPRWSRQRLRPRSWRLEAAARARRLQRSLHCISPHSLPPLILLRSARPCVAAPASRCGRPLPSRLSRAAVAGAACPRPFQCSRRHPPRTRLGLPAAEAGPPPGCTTAVLSETLTRARALQTCRAVTRAMGEAVR
jgi:hypothetical protein